VERDPRPGATLPTARITVASPSYFATLGVPLRHGRAFAGTDVLDAPPVAVVNQAFASRYLAGSDAVGQRIAIGSPERPRRWATIVGVVADHRNSGVARPVRPEIFIPVRQQTAWNQLFLLVRGDRAGALVSPVRSAVTALDPEQPVYAVQTLEEALTESSFQQRISAMLLGIFAAVALALAAIGIYGVMAYTVSARTQEMGVRLAMGAQRRDVIWMIVRQVLVLSITGLLLGTAGVLAAGKALSGLLYGVRPSDPLTMVVVTGLLCGVALLAASGPAVRAARVDPIDALRYE
jgi:putative ABC transport system permease protein